MNEYFQQGKYSSFELKELLKAYQKATDSYFISSITDLEGFIIYANPSFCEISQYSSTELIGKTHKIMSANHHSADFFKGMWGTISVENMGFQRGSFSYLKRKFVMIVFQSWAIIHIQKWS